MCVCGIIIGATQRPARLPLLARFYVCVCVCVCPCVNVSPCQPLDITQPSHGKLLGSVAEWIRLFSSSLFGLGQTSSNSLMGVEGGCNTEGHSFICPYAPWACICMESDFENHILTTRRPGNGQSENIILRKWLQN